MNLERARCASCGSTRTEPEFSAADPDGLSPDPFEIVRCSACGMVFVDPRPAESDLRRFYAAGYYDKPGEDSGAMGRRLGRLFMIERVAKAARGRAPGRVLDVGCGEGTFLAAMARRGWDAWGIEVSAEGAARAAARPGLRVLDKRLEDCDLEPASFDLITLWHSIEHVPDPEALLRRAAALLKDGGTLFLAFPNPESWDFALFGPRWFHLDPPRHLHYFSPKTMGSLLERCGLEPEGTSHVSFEYNPFGFVQSVLNVLTGRMNFMYRRLKGTFPRGEKPKPGETALTALLLPVLAALSLPYTLAAALFRSSGCVDVRAAAKRKHL
jgi:2-polyprenyl-3-methyl-5-hydroxy-6-metoxy-1,4-benzoquinol methylase